MIETLKDGTEVAELTEINAVGDGMMVEISGFEVTTVCSDV